MRRPYNYYISLAVFVCKNIYANYILFSSKYVLGLSQ